MKRIICTLTLLLLAAGIAGAAQPRKEIVKTGWNFGALPAFSYDNDLGFQFGGLGQAFFYGDGTIYPNYLHKVQAFACVYSRGAKRISLNYDSKYLIPGMRVTADLSYMDNPLNGFYGFNGAVAPYYDAFNLRKNADRSDGIAFYDNYQKEFLASLMFRGRLTERVEWLGGASYSWQDYSDVSIHPYDGTQTLFHQYVASGLIPVEDCSGHRVELRAGAVVDSRDFESNPERGVFGTFALRPGASFSAGGVKPSLKLYADFRQYVPLIPSYLTLAYQLAYEGLVAGSLPFYALPAFAMRGSFGRRIVGDGVAWTSADLRLTVARFQALKQNVELGLVGFADAGGVVQPCRLAEQSLQGGWTAEKTLDGTASGPYRSVFDPAVATRERLHASVGGGFFFAMNRNFIVAVEVGRPLNPQDSTLGVYMNLGFSF